MRLSSSYAVAFYSICAAAFRSVVKRIIEEREKERELGENVGKRQRIREVRVGQFEKGRETESTKRETELGGCAYRVQKFHRNGTFLPNNNISSSLLNTTLVRTYSLQR